MTWALDLDGVLWRGSVPIPGSADAVAALRAAGERVVFLTNNSALPIDAYVRKLGDNGVEVGPEDVASSAQAAARLVQPGERVLLCAGAGAEEALRQRGADVVSDGPADAVVVGLHLEFDYGRLHAAMSAVVGGARLIGTNEDRSYPTADGAMPGAGSLLAAVAYAASAVPVVAGKPHAPMAELVQERFGRIDMVVGDLPATDGRLARRLGARFALVLSGVTAQADGVDPAPDLVADDLASLVAAYQPG